MKKILISLLFAAAFIACGNKNTIKLPPMQVENKIQDKHISLEVNDLRTDKNIATIANIAGIPEQDLGTNVPLNEWLKTSLQVSLAKRGIDVLPSDMFADLLVYVNIKEIHTKLDGMTGENLSGNFIVDLIIKKGEKTITVNLAQPTKDYTILLRHKAVEDFTISLLEDLSQRIASEIQKAYQ